MKQFLIAPDVQDFEITGQSFSEKYTVYRLKDISEANRKFFTNLGYADKNDIVSIIKHGKGIIKA